MAKDMFGIEIRVGHYVAYIGDSKKRKDFVESVDGKYIKFNKGKKMASWNCVSLETQTST